MNWLVLHSHLLNDTDIFKCTDYMNLLCLLIFFWASLTSCVLPLAMQLTRCDIYLVLPLCWLNIKPCCLFPEIACKHDAFLTEEILTHVDSTLTQRCCNNYPTTCELVPQVSRITSLTIVHCWNCNLTEF